MKSIDKKISITAKEFSADADKTFSSNPSVGVHLFKNALSFFRKDTNHIVPIFICIIFNASIIFLSLSSLYLFYHWLPKNISAFSNAKISLKVLNFVNSKFFKISFLSINTIFCFQFFVFFMLCGLFRFFCKTRLFKEDFWIENGADILFEIANGISYVLGLMSGGICFGELIDFNEEDIDENQLYLNEVENNILPKEDKDKVSSKKEISKTNYENIDNSNNVIKKIFSPCNKIRNRVYKIKKGKFVTKIEINKIEEYIKSDNYDKDNMNKSIFNFNIFKKCKNEIKDKKEYLILNKVINILIKKSKNQKNRKYKEKYEAVIEFFLNNFFPQEKKENDKASDSREMLHKNQMKCYFFDKIEKETQEQDINYEYLARDEYEEDEEDEQD